MMIGVKVAVVVVPEVMMMVYKVAVVVPGSNDLMGTLQINSKQ